MCQIYPPLPSLMIVVGSQAILPCAGRRVATPLATPPSEYVAVHVTVQMLPVCLTVEGLHVALVTTASSLATSPAREFWASAATQASVVHELVLSAAAGGPDGDPPAFPVLAHPDRAAMAMAAAAINVCVRLVMA